MFLSRGVQLAERSEDGSRRPTVAAPEWLESGGASLQWGPGAKPPEIFLYFLALLNHREQYRNPFLSFFMIENFDLCNKLAVYSPNLCLLAHTGCRSKRVCNIKTLCFYDKICSSIGRLFWATLYYNHKS